MEELEADKSRLNALELIQRTAMSEAQEATSSNLDKKEEGRKRTEEYLKTRSEFRKTQKAFFASISDPKARFRASAKSFMDEIAQKHLGNPNVEFCATCWLLKRACLCSKLKKLSTRHRYINWLHYKETWRTTNTGTLLPQSCDNAKLLIHGKEEDDLELERTLTEESANTVFLYPSPTSISFREYFERRRSPEEGPITDWEAFLQTAPVINVIGVDSTWSQARAMSNGVPEHIPRVHLTDPPKFSVSRMRNQASIGRITTAEAFACALRELGETSEAIESLFYNLQVRCDAVDSVSGHGSKAEPHDSVANREARELANLAAKEEKRARKAAAAAAAQAFNGSYDASSSSAADASSSTNRETGKSSPEESPSSL